MGANGSRRNIAVTRTFARGTTGAIIWYLYYEQYPGVAYGLSIAAKLPGPWFQAAGNQQPGWDKYHLPPKVRHGSMLAITRKQYDALVVAFGKAPTK